MYLLIYPLYYIQLIMGSQVATPLLYFYWYVNKEYAQYSDSQEGKIIWLKGDKQKNWCIHSYTISTHNKYCKLFYFHDVKI